ncbi:MAG TPA: hypothetical protein VMS78_15285 [Rhizomicrobium sp.]|nr:hypothetical protein [Rhizomicrobium sp.]
MNKGGKQSNFIDRSQACLVVNGVIYSFCIGKPLVQSVTLHPAKGGMRPQARRLQAYFLKHATDWLRIRAGLQPYYVYVWENPLDGGLHSHILIHVPLQIWPDFRLAADRWVEAACASYGGYYQPGIIRISNVYGFEEYANGTSLLFDFLNRGVRGSLNYLLKGIDGNTEDILDMVRGVGIERSSVTQLTRHPNQQGMIVGKRVGCSVSLSPTRQKFPSIAFDRHRNLRMSGPEERALSLLASVGLEMATARGESQNYAGHPLRSQPLGRQPNARGVCD